MAVLSAALTAMGYEPAVDPQAPPKAKPFDLHDVRLLDSQFKHGQTLAVNYLLELNPDKLLANFRKEAGLEPKAEHYGGWESQEISGHSAGHYLSGLAQAWASTGEIRLLERINYVVKELALCQKAHGDGYVAAIPNGKAAYEEISKGNIRSSGFDLNGLWVPNYNIHKTFAGLRDAYRLAGNQRALEVAKKLADWFEKIHADLTEAQMQKILAAEHGGLNEVFADLYADTGDERYLKLSKRFHHKAVLEPLENGKDILPGKHANTQFPKLIGLARRYELTGNKEDRSAAQYFWQRVVHHHSYVTGGNSNGEHFGPPDQLNNRLSPNSTETCNVYNMLKLTQHVFGWNPKAQVADYFERALLNHIRASQNPKDGRVTYYLSLLPGHYKEFERKFSDFTCCVGTGMENHVRYGKGIYFHNEEGVWVNLFIPSEVRWDEKGVSLRQETGFPAAESSRFTLQTQKPQRFALRIRRPHWAKQGLQVFVNGEIQSAVADASGYVEIDRVWHSGDQVYVSYPMSLRMEAMPDNPKRIAVFYGPTLLAADLGPVDDPKADRLDYVPVLLAENRPPSEWIKPVENKKLVFRTVDVGKPRDVTLVPFHRVHDRRYTVYFDVFTKERWEAQQQQIRAEKQRQQELKAKTIDFFQPGEMQPERDHNLLSEKSSAGEAFGRKWRHAVDGGWFSFEMKVNPSHSMKLVCTYWGGDSGGRVFDILIDGQKIAEQQLQNNHPNRFFDAEYDIPHELIEGKEKVTVKLQAHPQRTAGGLFGARMIKE